MLTEIYTAGMKYITNNRISILQSIWFKEEIVIPNNKQEIIIFITNVDLITIVFNEGNSFFYKQGFC